MPQLRNHGLLMDHGSKFENKEEIKVQSRNQRRSKKWEEIKFEWGKEGPIWTLTLRFDKKK